MRRPLPQGPRLDQKEHPQLWHAVTDLALIADARAPDEITVSADVELAVHDEGSLFRSRSRRLDLGLPLLACYSVTELRGALSQVLRQDRRPPDQLPELRAEWERFRQRFLPMAEIAGRTPDVLAGFRAFLGFAGDRADAHIPLPPSDRPSWTMLTDPADTVPRLEAEVFGLAHGPRANWSEIAALAGKATAYDGARALTGAAIHTGIVRTATVAALLQAIEHDHAADLVRPLLNREPSPALVRDVLGKLLADTVAAALISIGRARFCLDWKNRWRVLLWDGSQLTPEQLVATHAVDVSDPEDIPVLRERLIALGVPPEFVPPSAAAPRPRLAGLVTSVKYQRKLHDLLVYDNGLLFLPQQAVMQRRFATSVGQDSRLESARIVELSETAPERLRAHAGALWLSEKDIGAGTLRDRALGWTLTLLLTNGAEVVAASTAESEDHGSAMETIATLLRRR